MGKFNVIFKKSSVTLLFNLGKKKIFNNNLDFIENILYYKYANVVRNIEYILILNSFSNGYKVIFLLFNALAIFSLTFK